MREMKNSGFEWIGTIPCHWNLTRIANLYRVRNQKVSDKDFPPLSVTMKGIVPQLETAAKTNDGDNRKLVRVGDFAINSRSDRRGSCGISALDGSVSLINTVLMPLSEMNPWYYNWLFHTVQFADEYYKCGHGIVDDLWTTTWQEMKKIVIPTPPLDEQKKIAEFLDTKCSEIDALVADIQAQIETLEQYKRSTIAEAVTKGTNPNVSMKDSGYEWIGDTPASWDFIKGKYLFEQRTSKGNNINLQLLSPSQKFGVVPQTLLEELTTQNVVKVKEDTDLTTFKTIHVGDFCISLRSFQGGFEYCRYEGVVSSAYQVFYPKVKICDDYYRFLFKDRGFIEKMNSYTISFRDGKNIAFSDFGNTYIPYPSVEEQKEIAKYLCEKTAEIDLCVESKTEQIATLESYKKSIIFEYVTGKKEVV